MPKIGYIFLLPNDASLMEDKGWMLNYGCSTVVEEEPLVKRERPRWKPLLSRLERGDELVISKFSNAIQSTMELLATYEYCRIKDIRLISIHDKFDSRGELFPDTRPTDVMDSLSGLEEEVYLLRQVQKKVDGSPQDQSSSQPFDTSFTMTKPYRDSLIVRMYKERYSIDDIWKVSGFSSRSSIFRILNKRGVELNRGKFCGSRKKSREMY